MTQILQLALAAIGAYLAIGVILFLVMRTWADRDLRKDPATAKALSEQLTAAGIDESTNRRFFRRWWVLLWPHALVSYLTPKRRWRGADHVAAIEQRAAELDDD